MHARVSALVWGLQGCPDSVLVVSHETPQLVTRHRLSRWVHHHVLFPFKTNIIILTILTILVLVMTRCHLILTYHESGHEHCWLESFLLPTCCVPTAWVLLLAEDPRLRSACNHCTRDGVRLKFQLWLVTLWETSLTPGWCLRKGF